MSSSRSRYSTWSSSSSDAWSVPNGGPTTPRSEDSLSLQFESVSMVEKVSVGSLKHVKRETWWEIAATPEVSIRDLSVCLDDSPTIPTVSLPTEKGASPYNTVIIPNTIRPRERQGKQATRPSTLIGLGNNHSSPGPSRDPFLVESSVHDTNLDQIDGSRHQAYAERPKTPIAGPSSIHRPFTQRALLPPLPTTKPSRIRPPLPSFCSTPDFSAPPAPSIPSRSSSRKRPVPPSRGSSLRSITQSSQTASSSHPPPRSFPPLKPSTLASSVRRPVPARSTSHPPPVTTHSQLRSSASLKRSVTPTPLQPISETPRDLDVSPDASWALRKPHYRQTLHRSKSQPNLRAPPSEMTFKLKLKRSNSQSVNPGTFVSRDAFPGQRRDSLDLGSLRDSGKDANKERAGRASFSDMTRTFMRDRGSLDESPTLPSDENLGPSGMKRSPRTQSFLSMRRNGKKRPSLLAFPETWSPQPVAPRSTSEPVMASLSTLPSSSLKIERLRLPRISTELKVVFNASVAELDVSTPDLEPDSWTKKEAIEAVLEAEGWTWPTPPSPHSAYSPVYKYRMEREDTPGMISTTDTIDSFSPQTPSSSEFCLHGEVEWLAREKKGEGNREDATAEGSVEILDISP
ncbi:hypothetical protein CI109_105705 [Kwoniella shandongensis]|uniref:Uncharacterized protein n=1 Tax=Kwoniella shandongensis TaxID=1734106 RepID=A0AAJ8MZX1_9TREE